MWTEEDDEEIEYGKWNDYDAMTALAEEYKVHPPKKIEKIWPHWGEGIPTKLRLKVYNPACSVGEVHHRSCEYYKSLELNWNSSVHAIFFGKKQTLSAA